MNIEPIKQLKLFGLGKFFNELVELDNKSKLPNKILLSGNKGLGKSTLAYHFTNYILSKDEEFSYDLDKYEINTKSRSFKTILNRSNPNFKLIDVHLEKKFIDINQIRELINDLNKSSFNNKPRIILIDNIELLNVNSINALLKILEEPSTNIYFILIHNNKKILPTLLSRCLNFKIFLTHQESLKVANNLLEGQLTDIINPELINFYSSPGNIYKLVSFGVKNNYELKEFDLKDFINLMIKDNQYKKDVIIRSLIFDFIEFYFRKINLSITSSIYEKYTYFINRISETKKFNLDEESLFLEFKDKILDA